MSVARALPFFLIAFLIGIASAWVFPVLVTLSLVLLLCIGALLLFFIERAPRILFLALCLGFLALGVSRGAIALSTSPDPILANAVGDTVTLAGVVIDEPDVRERTTHLVVRADEIRTETTSRAVSGVLIAFAPRYPEFRYGDVVELSGKLELPEVLTEEDGRTFDYPSYLAAKGIAYTMFAREVVGTGEERGNPIKSTLFDIKKHFQNALTEALPEPQSALLSGLLLGGKQSLGEDWLERFRVAGIVHIVVLSGYNMTIVAEWLVVIFRFLGFFGSLSAGALGIVAFAVMTGGGATVVRAAIMAILVLIARATGRTAEMGRALLVAAALMVMVSPRILLFDPSFQLSFLASLGLVFVAPALERRIPLRKGRLVLREVIISTLATQIMVLPLLLFQTGMLSIVALPTNVIVLPLIPVAMLAGFVAGVVVLVVPALWLVVGIVPYILLSYILIVAEHAARIPFAAVSVTLSLCGVALAYLAIAVMLFREAHRARASSSLPPLPREALSPPQVN
jgi:competence protein ComEC